MTKLKSLILSLLLTTGLCFPTVIFAETIILKSGETIKAKVTDVTEDYITVETQGAYKKYDVSEVESIDGWICTKEKIKDSLSKKTTPVQIVSLLPEGWKQIPSPSGRYSRVYLAGDKPGQILQIKTRDIYAPGQTALQWAQDEIKAIENAKTNKVLEIKKVTPPRAFPLDNFNWTVLEWEGINSNKRLGAVSVKSRQYYAKIDKDSLIEVVVWGPARLFETTNNEDVVDYLSSITVVKTLSEEETGKLARQEDKINKNLKNFTITSPKYTEQIAYMRSEPPFTITAPKDWYMALKKEKVGGVDRAFFCKYDPNKPPPRGALWPFKIPYIKIAFLPNPQALPAITWSTGMVPQLKSMGASILTDEKIKIDNRSGVHVTSSLKEENLTMDVYIFTMGNAFISVKTTCRSNEFEKTKKSIKEAINSIKFSSYLEP